jgi:ubiquinone/menaquinone biosynthesis C-methylase UbiE
MDVANRRPLHLAVDALDPRPGECILDAGCGTGAAMALLLRRAACRVTGVDSSETMLATARARLGDAACYLEASLDGLPFEAGGFDAVLALNVLYFNGPDEAMLRELRRVLRPGGRLIGYVTDRSTMQGWAFASKGLHRLYDAEGLKAACLRAGFAENAVRVAAVPVMRGVDGLLVEARR